MGAIDTFLSDEEMKKLTGCSYKKLQIEVLRKNGIKFTLNHQGRPVIMRSTVDGTAKGGSVDNKPAWTPRILKMTG